MSYDLAITAATDIGEREEQQDRYLVHKTKFGTLLAVMDGHGGAQVAQVCAEFLPDLWDQLSWEFAPDTALREVVGDLAFMTREFQETGSTLSVVYIDDRHVAHIAVLGDSPVIVKDRENRLSVSPSHNVRVSREEMAAAVARGGLDRGDGYVYLTPYGSGLQMSRALGDGALGPVISKEPDIYQVPIGEYLLLATDGVFGSDNRDFIRQVSRVVVALDTWGDEAQDLVKRTTEDNATAIVVRRKYEGAEQSNSLGQPGEGPGAEVHTQGNSDNQVGACYQRAA